VKAADAGRRRLFRRAVSSRSELRQSSGPPFSELLAQAGIGIDTAT